MTGSDLIDATICALLIGILLVFAIEIGRLRKQPFLTTIQVWLLAFTGTLLCMTAGFIWFAGSLILGIMNSPKWPFSDEGAPSWVDPVFDQAIPVGVLISLSLLFFLFRFLRHRLPPPVPQN